MVRINLSKALKKGSLTTLLDRLTDEKEDLKREMRGLNPSTSLWKSFNFKLEEVTKKINSAKQNR